MKRINQNKILVGGDKKKAKAFIGDAQSQMEILKQSMSFQNLTQGIRRVTLFGNVEIECRKIFNYQECRIYIKPTGGEETTEDFTLYYYVRIKNTGEEIQDMAAVGAGSQPVAQWKLDNFPNIIMDRLIVYNAGSGDIVLDVDVHSEIVYTGSAGYLVETDLTEEAQLELAKAYIQQIDHPELDESYIPIVDPFDEYFDIGFMGDHMAMAKSCDGDDLSGAKSISEYAVGPRLGDIFYAMHPSPQRLNPVYACDTAREDYETHHWEDLSSLADNYYYDISAPELYNYEQISLGSGWQVGASPSFAGTAAMGSGTPEHGKYSIHDGMFFAPLKADDKSRFKPFFVLLKKGAEYPVKMSRGKWNDVVSDWGEGYANLGVSGASETSIVTPFEEVAISEVMITSDNGCPCVPQCWCDWVGPSGSGGGDPGNEYGGLSVSEYWPEYPCPGGAYGEQYTVSNESTGERFWTDCKMAEDFGSGNGFAMFIYRERNSERDGQLHKYLSRLCRESNYGFDLYLLFYILIPDVLFYEDADTGEQTLFDIYQYRNDDEATINSYRALNLEEYVMEIVKEKKEEYIYSVTGVYFTFTDWRDPIEPYILNNTDDNSMYHNITTGFLKPILEEDI